VDNGGGEVPRLGKNSGKGRSMKRRVDLLRYLPRSHRDLSIRRERTPHTIAIARQYGQEYFDGPRLYGYGGYKDDGRWIPVAHDIVSHFGLRRGDKVLDVGCAKGFLVKQLRRIGMDALGVDISSYAIEHAEEGIRPFLLEGCASKLPFENASFDCVLSINTLHNLPRLGVLAALREIMRVTRVAKAFVQVDSYETPEQKQALEEWVLTAKFYGSPRTWRRLFFQAGYTGDYNWTLIE
jgi:SAM-dependent methyltransferase